jgi:hypothetical protein
MAEGGEFGMYIMVIEYLLFLVYLTRRKAVREEEMKTTDGKEFMREHPIFVNR